MIKLHNYPTRIILCILFVFLLFTIGYSSLAFAKEYGLATASMGGAYYPMGQAISTIVSKYTEDISLIPEITSGAVENPRLVDSGATLFGITNSSIAYFAFEGTAPYEKKLNILAIANLHPSVFHIITLKDSSINSISDLKGKKVAVGPAGGGTMDILPILLEEYDMSIADIRSSYLPYTDAFIQLADGNIDAAFALGGYPLAGVTQLTATHDVKFLDIDDVKLNNIMGKHPYYSKSTIPKNIYNLEKDAIAIGVKNLFITKSDADEELVYKITKVVYSHLEELSNINITAKQINLEKASETSIPLHPGAAKFFEENN